MIPIPMELLTMGGSFIAGTVAKIVAAKAEAKREERAYELQAMAARADERMEVRKVTDIRFKKTRQIIAITVIFAVMVLPKLAALLQPDLIVSYGWTTSTSGWLWGLFGGKETLVWNEVRGLAITPLDTHFAAAIAGLYMGADQGK